MSSRNVVVPSYLSTILVSDYSLVQISRKYTASSFPLVILKNKWFKEKDLYEILNYYKIDPHKINSLVLIEKNKMYIKSTAALRLTKYLKGAYPIAFVFIIIPAVIRNFVYDYIAQNRYKWYGKLDSCIIPDGELAKRFL